MADVVFYFRIGTLVFSDEFAAGCTNVGVTPNIEEMILKDDTVGHFGSFVVTGPKSSIFFEILLLVSELQCFEISNLL